MRIGVNPEKDKETKLVHKNHRIIIPFWIPNVEDEYFKNQPEVLRLCLKSLTETIDIEKTNITLINNNSCLEASNIAKEFVSKGLIDKYIVRSENRGKLENVLSEVRASYENFITISDADFLFSPGWESEVFSIMETFPYAGMVTCYPAAHLAYQYNCNIILHPLKIGKIVTDEDVDLFEKGHGHPIDKGLYSYKKLKLKYIWRDKQYYLKKNNQIALLGAVHALATFRKEVTNRFNPKLVEYIFKRGYEEEYIDMIVEKSGYLRLSTAKLFAYHMGNTIPEDVLKVFEQRKTNWSNDNQKHNRKKTKVKSNKLRRFFYPLIKIVFRVLRKFRLI